jgi:peptide/nickel transport system ATP-binding protein
VTLRVRDLTVQIGPHRIVEIDELDIPPGRRLGLVGESGSGKTMTAMTLAGLQPRDAVVKGSIELAGQQVVGMHPKRAAEMRGSDIGVIFQYPLRALNPTMRIGRQIGEALRLQGGMSRKAIKGRVHELLAMVQLRDPERIARRYPHQLSGGQQQRVLIAIAISRNPKLLIADEPTTALDVTVQKGILELLVEISEQQDASLLFVSHDLGVVRAVSEHIAVLYGGHLVETGPTDVILERPHHRYTEALIAANPGHAADEIEERFGQRLQIIRGSVPPLGGFPPGCRFRGRCEFEVERCQESPLPSRQGSGHTFKCWNPAQEGTEDVAAH